MIKINSNAYYLSSNSVIYFKNQDNEYTVKSIADITAGKQYQLATLYLDSSVNNKVAMIVINQ